MFLIGDALTFTVLIVGGALSSWALLLCLALVFERRSRIAMERIEQNPVRQLFAGLALAVLVGVPGVIMAVSPPPLVKILGLLIVLVLLGLSFAGSAGLVMLASARIRHLDSGCSPYTALSRGALFVVLPTILPILGWFLVAPVVILIGLGAGTVSMLKRNIPAAVPA